MIPKNENKVQPSKQTHSNRKVIFSIFYKGFEHIQITNITYLVALIEVSDDATNDIFSRSEKVIFISLNIK